jgi:hypothetical protein
LTVVRQSLAGEPVRVQWDSSANELDAFA